MTEDFYINYKNMKISYIKKHLQNLIKTKNIIIFHILEKDKNKNLLKIQSVNKEIIKQFLFNNYYGSYNLNFKDKNFLKSLPSAKEIEFSNINFISRDIYKISERYIENNTYFYSTPTLKEKDIVIADNNKIQNLKITDCENFSYETGFKLVCKYFPFKISRDGLNFNFFNKIFLKKIIKNKIIKNSKPDKIKLSLSVIDLKTNNWKAIYKGFGKS